MKQGLWFVIILSLLVVSNHVSAQIDCQVTVNMDQIPSSEKEQLSNFAQDIQNYINSNKWAFDDLGGEKIKCSMTVFFISVKGTGSYAAQVFIGSQRPVYVGKNPSAKISAMVRLFDDKWEFNYLKNQQLYRNENQFDPLTDFIDFYMYLIVGFDYDSYDPLSGTPYFQKALNFCSQAPSSAKGWDRVTSGYCRVLFVEELLDPKIQPFRDLYYRYHFKGLDLLATKPAEGYKSIISLLQKVDDMKKSGYTRSLVFKSFFEAKYSELAETFRSYDDKSIYRLLISADPAHQPQYEAALKK